MTYPPLQGCERHCPRETAELTCSCPKEPEPRERKLPEPEILLEPERASWSKIAQSALTPGDMLGHQADIFC